MMSMFKSLMLAATLAAASGVAIAAPAAERMSDVQFLQLNRCAGLVSAPNMGGDGKVVEAAVREQGRGRDPYIMQRADEVRDQATRDARHASGERAAKLAAERDGVCQRLAPNAAATTVAHAPPSGATPSAN